MQRSMAGGLPLAPQPDHQHRVREAKAKAYDEAGGQGQKEVPCKRWIPCLLLEM